jgi:hypothetical protein
MEVSIPSRYVVEGKKGIVLLNPRLCMVMIGLHQNGPVMRYLYRRKWDLSTINVIAWDADKNQVSVDLGGMKEYHRAFVTPIISKRREGEVAHSYSKSLDLIIKSRISRTIPP